MKKLIFFLPLLCVIATAFCQNQAPSYDSSFRALYKAVALHPGYRNRQGIMHDSVIKRWDRDIKIFVEGSSSKSRREVLAKLKNTIAIISPAMENKIRISFTDDKSSANYLIDLNFRGSSGWHVKWDGLYNIYSCMILINTRTIFNLEEQAGLVSHYFLQSLGDFVFSQKDRPVFVKDDPAVATNISLWRRDISGIDLQILKLHYADDIKPGMAEKDIDQFFARHAN